MDLGCFRHASPIIEIALSDGTHRKAYGKPLVSAPAVNPKLVNGSAPDLFPLTIVLNKHFIPAAITSPRGIVPAGSNSAQALQENGFQSLMTSH
jgi:hypothetical protein